MSVTKIESNSNCNKISEAGNNINEERQNGMQALL